MKRPAHMTLVDADRYSALVSRCTEQRERAEKAEARIEPLETFAAVARRFHGAGSVCEQNRARRRTICEICDGLAALAAEEKTHG